MIRVKRINLIVCLALLWLFSIVPVNAAPPSAAPAEPTTNPVFDTWNWRLAAGGLVGGIVDKGSPTLADLSNPPDGIPEVIIGTTARNGAGGFNQKTLLVALTRDAGSPGGMKIWFATDVGAPINSTPAVADIDGDGLSEIVVGLGGDVDDVNQHGGIAAYEHNGTLKWFFYTHDWLDENGYADGVFSSPTLCDVDSDGDLEIAFGGWDQRIYLLDHNGNALWSTPGWGDGYFNQDTVWSSAACADLNHDGNKEIIIGADMTQGTLLDGTQVQDGGMLYIFDKDGNVLVRRYTEEAIYAAPAVGDLDGDGDLEIVSGTSFSWWEATGGGVQPRVYVFDTNQVFGSKHYSDPTKLPNAPGWPQNTTYPGFSSPALADLDGDDDLEIVIGSGDPYQNSGSGDYVMGEGKVYAWHHDGTPISGWPVTPVGRWGSDTYVTSSPTIADVDGDGGLEILFAMMHSVHVYNVDGTLQELTQLNTPYPTNGLLQTWEGGLWSSPTVGDANGDGNLEIWIGGTDNKRDPGVGQLWRFEADKAMAEMPWPSFHCDVQNRGLYGTPELGASPGSIYVMHEYGSSSPESDMMFVFNAGVGEIDWEATSPAAVTLSATSGTVDGAGQAVTVTISTGGYPKGMHSLGDIMITGTVEGDAAPGSPITIPVTLYVGTVYKIYTPMVVGGY